MGLRFLMNLFLFKTSHFRLEIASGVRNFKILQQHRIAIRNHKFSAYAIYHRKISIYSRDIRKIIYNTPILVSKNRVINVKN